MQNFHYVHIKQMIVGSFIAYLDMLDPYLDPCTDPELDSLSYDI